MWEEKAVGMCLRVYISYSEWKDKSVFLIGD